MRNVGIGFALATAIFATVGLAYAAIPHSQTGVISSCVSWIGGHVRVIDAENGKQCYPWENPLDWNQTGPTGPQGIQGEQGEPGPTWYVYNVLQTGVAVPGNGSIVSTLNCNSGDLAISGGYDLFAFGNIKVIRSALGDFPNGWSFIYVNSGPTEETLNQSVMCINPSP